MYKLLCKLIRKSFMKFVNNKQYRPYALKSSRRHVGGGGVQAIALYALVICDWHISDKRLYA